MPYVYMEQPAWPFHIQPRIPTIFSTPPAAAPPSLSHTMAMGVVTWAKKRTMEEEERLADRISNLPDGVLGDIVSLLPTKAGARTQVLSSRWRHIWRSAPLNIDLHLDLHDPAERRIAVEKIPRVLSAHPGPGRRFSIPKDYLNCDNRRTALDRWLQSRALKNLQELDLNSNLHQTLWILPASVHRFSSTLRVASFSGFHFPDGTNAKAFHLPLLEQLTLVDVSILESSLHAMLAGCSVLQSLLLLDSYGFPRLQIVSHSLRSIGMRAGWKGIRLEQLIVMDAPCLQRLLFFEGTKIDISVISAPRLNILGKLFDNFPKLQFSTTVFQGSTVVSMTTVVHSVKVLALSDVKLSLDMVIVLMKCFPHLEKLYIKASRISVDNVWYHKYQKLIGTHDIRLRKIVLVNYQGSKTHINFAKFFVLNARVLESMRLELEVQNFSKAWIARQRSLLNIKRRALRGARITFVSRKFLYGSLDLLHVEQVHDLSIDPFERFHQ